MSGPTYISNPALWEQFRHTVDGENFNPTIRRNSQRGGGILNRRKAYMIPLKARVAQPNVQLVTPVAAERERALSDLKETIRNDEPHVPLKKAKKKRPPRNPSVVPRHPKGEDVFSARRTRSVNDPTEKRERIPRRQRKLRPREIPVFLKKTSFKYGVSERNQHVGGRTSRTGSL